MADDNLRGAVQALADHLQAAIKSNELADIPERIWNQFRPPVERFSTATLRPLYNIFDKPKQNNGLRLKPQILSAIISMILHTDPSLHQQRVLHTLMDAVRIYQDETALLAVLKHQRIAGMEQERVGKIRASLTSNLLGCVVEIIKSHTDTPETRWTAAQLFSIVVKKNSHAREILYREHDCRDLGSLVQSSADLILRYLVADAIRELLHHHTDRNLLWPSGTASEISETFPTEEHSTPTWLFNVRNYFSELDKTVAFVDGHSSSFWVNEISRSHSSESSPKHIDASNAVVSVSREIHCLIAADSLGLKILEYPLFSPEVMNIKPSIDDALSSTMIDIEYNNDHGYIISNGSKTSLTGLALDLANVDDVPIFLNEICQAQGKQLALDHIRHNEKQLPAVGPRISYALLDLEDADDEADEEQGLGLPEDTTCAAHTQLIDQPQEKERSALDSQDFSQALAQFIDPDMPETDQLATQPRGVNGRVCQSSGDDTADNLQNNSGAAEAVQVGANEPDKSILAAAPIAHLCEKQSGYWGGTSSAQIAAVQTRSFQRRPNHINSVNQIPVSDDEVRPSKDASRIEVVDSQNQSRKTRAKRTSESSVAQSPIIGSTRLDSVSISFPSEVSNIDKQRRRRLKQKTKVGDTATATAKRAAEARSKNNNDRDQDLQSVDEYELSDEDQDAESPLERRRKSAESLSGTKKAAKEVGKVTRAARQSSFVNSIKSFRERLHDPSKHTGTTKRHEKDFTGKKSFPSHPSTPFGNKAKVVQTVNCAGSNSASRRVTNPTPGKSVTAKDAREEAHENITRPSKPRNLPSAEAIDRAGSGSRQLPDSSKPLPVPAKDHVVAGMAVKSHDEVVNVHGGKESVLMEATNETNPPILEAAIADAAKEPDPTHGEYPTATKKRLDKFRLNTSSSNDGLLSSHNSRRKDILQVVALSAHPSTAALGYATANGEASSSAVLDHVTDHDAQTTSTMKSVQMKAAKFADSSRKDAPRAVQIKHRSEAKTPCPRSTSNKPSIPSRLTKNGLLKSPVVHFGLCGPRNQASAAQSPLPSNSQSRTVPAADGEHGGFKESAARGTLPVDRAPSHDPADEVLLHTFSPSGSKTQALTEASTVLQDKDDGTVVVGQNRQSANLRLDLDRLTSSATSTSVAHLDLEMSKPAPSRHSVDSSTGITDGRSGRDVLAGDAISADGASCQDFDNRAEADEYTHYRSQSEPASEYRQSQESFARSESRISSVTDDLGDPIDPNSHLSITKCGSTVGREWKYVDESGSHTAANSSLGTLITRSHPKASKFVMPMSLSSQSVVNLAKKPKVLDAIHPLRSTSTTAPRIANESNYPSNLLDVRPDLGENSRKTICMQPLSAKQLSPAGSQSAKVLGTSKTSTKTRSVKLNTLPSAQCSVQDQSRIDRVGPTRVDPNDVKVSAVNESSSQPDGTPAPYHSRLQEDLMLNQYDPTYTTDDVNDSTLINLARPTTSRYAAVSHKRSETTHYGTDSSADSSSVLDENEARGGMENREACMDSVRAAHQPLLDTVLQITTNVFFQLGLEEDVILAKTSEYGNGGQILVNELQASWNARMTHEKIKLDSNLQQARMALRNAKKECPMQYLFEEKPSAEAVNLQGIRGGIRAKEKATNSLLEALMDHKSVGQAQKVVFGHEEVL